MLVDAGLCATTAYLSVFLRLGFLPDRETPIGVVIAVSIFIALPIFRAAGLYREIFSQSGLQGIVGIGRACLLYAIPFAIVFTYVSIWGIPRTVGLIQPILLFVCVASSRVFARYWLGNVVTGAPRLAHKRRVILYGAGAAGRQLAGAIAPSPDMQVVGYFDDDAALQGSVLDGSTIFAPDDMAGVVERLRADEILLALPSAPRSRRNEIIGQARRANARIRTLPGLMDIAHGRVAVSDIRDLEIEDLLGRESVRPDPQLMGRNIHGKTVLITGAGGSIGSELCRQVWALGPATLLLLEVNEFALYEIHRELIARGDETAAPAGRIVPLLGSVLDEARMRSIVEAWRPDTIYHAAAYKHVPLVEHNPAEGVRNNVFGTLALARVAAQCGVPDFVLISTDKAVRPSNVMGATKRIAELILQALNEASAATRFSIVRFGNVLGSSGSVVPLFRQQIRNGGPVTVTDRRIIRYFMTVPEAAELVIQAGAMATGGEVFVLDMGEPVEIHALARNMIELAGLAIRDEASPDGDIEIVEIGLRPGEKLYEELLIGNDPTPTSHPRILKANEPFQSLKLLEQSLERLRRLLDTNDRTALVEELRRLVPEFRSETGAVDWVQLETGRNDSTSRNQNVA
uniref:polysaccharide biosynthesis protein n=1 Tax=Sphingomonas bacterium TaxID=1895847 RepID=UPI002633F4DE|nr:nucleoside-diphosphate sugar epimerase/dehydratase [Sphingomonas bacterium]